MVPRQPRRIERVEFGDGGHAPVVASMARLAEAGDGWVNLVPRLAEDVERPTSLTFFALLGGDSGGTRMCTWVPGRRDRRGQGRPSLGITHASGRRAGAVLVSLEIPVPSTWAVEQDHPRRGLVLRIPLDEPYEDVLVWSMRAMAALVGSPVARWQAHVHLPAAA